ncbi:hypothetical protein MPTK1_3g17140 [Marchantia polymorpha subsp. ruderalis]|uniref:Uncharacterized protein n=2 Tax=Marchantia polymorpha TaxID=3197 RepID=A0AAF6B1Q1_MARPO|nr:hypothetical protein MARPO_0039s0080 [Marchantia polymorpha]BBN05935.1 hypothetical protein Mp_3g17140 [Marchantia polymorpha subsp. ruderalis]|eukprot:PTQ40589.1 hypothetical protein MARPO_0039s0080 [Marchantia polymorpha]
MRSAAASALKGASYFGRACRCEGGIPPADFRIRKPVMERRTKRRGCLLSPVYCRSICGRQDALLAVMAPNKRASALPARLRCLDIESVFWSASFRQLSPGPPSARAPTVAGRLHSAMKEVHFRLSPLSGSVPTKNN